MRCPTYLDPLGVRQELLKPIGEPVAPNFMMATAVRGRVTNSFSISCGFGGVLTNRGRTGGSASTSVRARCGCLMASSKQRKAP